MKCAACGKEIRADERATHYFNGLSYHTMHDPGESDSNADIASIYQKISQKLDTFADAKVAIDIALGDPIPLNKEAFRNLDSKWRALTASYEQAKTIADKVGFGSLRLYIEAEERIIKYASADAIREVAAGYRSRIK